MAGEHTGLTPWVSSRLPASPPPPASRAPRLFQFIHCWMHPKASPPAAPRALAAPLPAPSSSQGWIAPVPHLPDATQLARGQSCWILCQEQEFRIPAEPRQESQRAAPAEPQDGWGWRHIKDVPVPAPLPCPGQGHLLLCQLAPTWPGTLPGMGQPWLPWECSFCLYCRTKEMWDHLCEPSGFSKSRRSPDTLQSCTPHPKPGLCCCWGFGWCSGRSSGTPDTKSSHESQIPSIPSNWPRSFFPPVSPSTELVAPNQHLSLHSTIKPLHLSSYLPKIPLKEVFQSVFV